MTDGYNGWTNYATWNVALWIGSDKGLYHAAMDFRRVPAPYKAFAADMRELGVLETPDHVAYNDRSLDIGALDEMIQAL